LSHAIGEVLHRASYMRVPGWAIKLVLGEFGNVILEGQRAIPKALLDAGFKFNYPEIRPALRNLLEHT
jgi:uncharacterized protein